MIIQLILFQPKYPYHLPASPNRPFMGDDSIETEGVVIEFPSVGIPAPSSIEEPSWTAVALSALPVSRRRSAVIARSASLLLCGV